MLRLFILSLLVFPTLMFGTNELKGDDLALSPVDQFVEWQRAAGREGPGDQFFILSTATKEGNVSSRVMTLKKVDKDGFYFSSPESQKTDQMTENDNVSLCFFWPEIYRQVIIEGKVEKLSDKHAKDSFNKQPRKVKITKLVSQPGEEINNWEEMDTKFKDGEAKYASCSSEEIPCPEHMTAWRVHPESIEFYQGQPHLRSQRVVYIDNDGKWNKKFIMP